MAQIWNKILRKVKDQKNSINGKYVTNILKKDLKRFVDRVQLLMAYGIILEGDGEKAKCLNSCFTAVLLFKKQSEQNGNGDSMVKRKEAQSKQGSEQGK